MCFSEAQHTKTKTKKYSFFSFYSIFLFFPQRFRLPGRGSYLSLNDVEEEVGVAAAAEEVTQAERLVQAFHLLLDLRWRSTRRTP